MSSCRIFSSNQFRIKMMNIHQLRQAFAAGVFTLWPLLSGAADLPFETLNVESRAVPETRWFDGTVEAVKKTTVSAQISSRIIEIGFDVGDFVEAGQVIARFNPAEPAAAVLQAEASHSEAIATRIGAKKEFSRLKKLYADRTVSRSQFDNAAVNLDAAKAREAAASAALGKAREHLQYTEVKAPYSGLVTARYVELGELANPGQKLMSGVSLDELRVSTSVPQRFANSIRKAGIARIIDDTGTIVDSSQLTVFPIANVVNHTVNVRAALESNSANLFPGMLVRVGFQTGESIRIQIPESALVKRGELVGVYRLTDNDQVRLLHVRTGRIDAESGVEIVSGLLPGDRIAVDALSAARFVSAAKATAGNAQ